jgi:hypothetical protein
MQVPSGTVSEPESSGTQCRQGHKYLYSHGQRGERSFMVSFFVYCVRALCMYIHYEYTILKSCKCT